MTGRNKQMRYSAVVEWLERRTSRRPYDQLEKREIEHRQRLSVVSLSKYLYPHCSVLASPTNGFENDSIN